MIDTVSKATKIIRNSIISSVYIDDKIVEPFTEITDGNRKYYDISKGLFDSFRNENKTIDFYKYDPNKDWQNDTDYIFKHRDLLVLDWQLNDVHGLRQVDTLKILKRAVQTDNLHFVSIYTESTDFDEIFYAIKAFFNTDHSVDNVEKSKQIIELLDNEGIETDFLSKIKNQFMQLSIGARDNKKITLEKLKKDIQYNLKDNYFIFAKGLKTINTDSDKACEIFGYHLNDEKFVEVVGFETEVKTDYISDNFIVVNHTIIQLTNKVNPRPTDLFTFFTEAIERVCGNLLTIISLEVRSLLRESSGFIGKDADSIKDEILFHQLDRKLGFFEFLMGIIKNHTLSYFDYKQGKLESVTKEFWEEYAKTKNIRPLLEHLQKEDNKSQLMSEMKKLNVYYNILHVNKYSSQNLRFGDVFYSENNGKKDGRFFLCITAHCDCSEPKENIKNNFFFVSGQAKNADELIAKGDDVFCSYLLDETKIIAVAWNPRPVIINITNPEIKDGNLFGRDGLGAGYSLVHHCTLKENYTQRMANNSFAHAMRVGIDFAQLKRNEDV